MPWGGYSDVNLRPVPVALLRQADAEEAKKNGGMIAIYPRQDDAMKLAVPGGEPIEDLHCTLAFLGDDVSQMDPTTLLEQLPQILDPVTVITARIMGHALFNPDGGPDGTFEPCAVYLVSDSEQLPDLHDSVTELLAHSGMDIPTQHQPWIPHVTAGYSLPIEELTYTGQILFDRVGLAFGPHTQFFPLMGSTL